VFWYSADKIDLLGANLRDFILTRLGLQHYDLERFEAQRKFVDILSSADAFFGIGPGNYELYSRMATHSLYLRYIGERGLFRFLSFCGVLGYSNEETFQISQQRFSNPSSIWSARKLFVHRQSSLQAFVVADRITFWDEEG
jgi:hypothetical protein